MPPKKLPIASRIKRMMQQDEDVGKVAATAPVVLSKALELFVKQLVTTTMDVALMHGAKIIQKTHLKGAIVMVPEAFDFLSDVVEDVEDLPPPPDLATLELELETKADGKKGKRKGRKKDDDGSLGDLGGGGNLGDLGDLGGGASLEAKAPAKRKASGGAKKARAKKVVKKEESEDEEEFDVNEEDTDDEDFEETYTAPKMTRTGRRVKQRKSYADDDDDDVNDEDEDFDNGGSLASLDPVAGHVGDDEDDYDDDE